MSKGDEMKGGVSRLPADARIRRFWRLFLAAVLVGGTCASVALVAGGGTPAGPTSANAQGAPGLTTQSFEAENFVTTETTYSSTTVVNGTTSVTSTSNQTVIPEPQGWSANGLWHDEINPQDETDTLSPSLVTLPDAGALPSAFSGDGVAWFGVPSGSPGAGSYCNIDYQVVAQTAKDGCTSAAEESGDLTSPTFALAGVSHAVLTFDSWWDIEGYNPTKYDTMTIKYSTDGGSTWTTAGELNPVSATSGTADQDYTSGGGIETAPAWQSYAVDLSGATGPTNDDDQVQFDFDTVDTSDNGFRGWLLDDVAVNATSSIAAPTVSSVSPASVACTSGATELDVLGTNFSVGSQVLLDGSPISSSDLSTTEMQATIAPGSLVAGTHTISVQSPASGTSNTVALTVTCTSSTVTTTSTITTSSSTTSTPLPPPVIYKTANVTPVSGTVYIKLPSSTKGVRESAGAGGPLASASFTKGKGYVLLTQARQIPVGSFLDTRGGTVAITAASPKPTQQYTANVTAGIFQLLQNRSQGGLTTLTLMDTTSYKKACVSAGKGRSKGKKASIASSKKVSSKVLGLLKSTDHGKFSTRGNYSAATVRGTEYSVEDTCAGTLTTVTRGSVTVDYFHRHHQQIVVNAGHEFLAKASGARSSVVSIGKHKTPTKKKKKK